MSNDFRGDLARLAALGAFCLASGTALATVNVNTAQQSELQSTRGLDKLAAKSIIEYRNQNGPYRSLDDLARVLGPERADQLASQVAFDGPPYIPPPKPEKKKRRK
jgi:competence protein ComEA